MGKSRRSKQWPNIIGTGPVTLTQTAFLVDRFLEDNGFTETRRHFRNEASSLLSSAPLRQYPENLLTLDQLLNDHILLKEQKAKLDEEKITVDNLLIGMQNVMDSYGHKATAPPAPPSQAVAFCQQGNFGYAQSGTQNSKPDSMLPDKRVDFATSSTSQSVSRKRKGPEVSVGVPPVFRKPRKVTAQEKLAANEKDKILQADKAATNVTSAASRGSGKANNPQKEVNPPTNGTDLTKGKFAISTPNFVPIPLPDSAFEGDLFSDDIRSNLYSSGENYPFAEFLNDLGVECEGATSLNAPIDTISMSSPESRNVTLEPNQVTSEYTSNVNQVIQEKDMSTQGYDTLAKFVANADESNFC